VRSGLYRGSLMHERSEPRRHRFRYRLPFAAVDLSEATELDRRLRLFGYNRRALFSLRDDDHIGDARRPLSATIAERMKDAGVPDIERVIMVGTLRSGGYVFNPLTLFYCYDGGDELAGVLAEVSNTFGERHAYCLPVSDAGRHGGAYVWDRVKSLHVSPFFGMDQRYQFRLTEPGERFGAVIDVSEDGNRVFRGSWSGVRFALNDANLARQAVRRPFSTQMVTARIHLQAAKLFVKRVPLHRKPPFDLDKGTVARPMPSVNEPLINTVPPAADTRLMRPARRILLGMLKKPAVGSVELRMPDGRMSNHGTEGTGPRTSVTIHSEDLYRRIARRGRLGLGEAYIAGDWDSDNLAGALEILARGSHRRAGGFTGQALNRLRRLRPRAMRTNSRSDARRDIAYHYDLGNKLYELFLDETWTYSCAYFEHPDQSLADAQRAKNRRLMDKLDITSDDHILEIGCGWGGFAIQAATERGAKVTGITLSAEQKSKAEQRVLDAKLEDLIDIQLVDFRDVKGTYSAIVSIEMLEAVGHKLLAPFFTACDERLAPGGRMGVQVICIPDQRYDAYRKGSDYIREYIFPGALLPSMSALAAAMRKDSDFVVRQAEDIAPHYATTLKIWRERFVENREIAAERGYGETFARTWEYYLAFCEAGFRVRALQDFQLVFARPLE